MLRKLLPGLGGLFLFLLLSLGLAWKGVGWYSNSLVQVEQEVGFVIVPGDSLIRVLNRLESVGVIEHPKVFRLITALEDGSTSLHAGEYLITPDMTKKELLDMFLQGQVRQFSVTLVEGRTLKEVLEVLNSHPKLSSPMELGDVIAIVDEMEEGGNPEGLFYPDTYHFESGTSVETILRIAYDRLEKVLADEWESKAEGLPYSSPYEALIMASIVERETGAPFERDDIAGVFVRRLNKRMRLQTDPTVIYGAGDRYTGRITRRMLREPTAYNTYVIRGLPPTPISLVGREAIHAALNPKEGSYLYFVAKGDGTHQFSNTLTEHNRAVRKYQIVERREDYRSTLQ